MLVYLAVASALAFAPVRPVGTFNSAVRTAVRRSATAIAQSKGIDEKKLDAAQKKLRKAAAMFGKEQKEAADKWLDKTLTTGGFSSSELLQQKITLFDECTINDDGSSNCMALDDALVDLQDAMAAQDALVGDATNSKKRLAQSSVNKAALGVRSADVVAQRTRSEATPVALNN